MKELPTKEMRGFWRLGYESSTFFRTLADAQSESVDAEHAVQLLNDPKETPELRQAWPKKKPRVFSIRFVGAESYTPGLYGTGHGAGAVIVRKVIDLQELHP
jgi:hypothetical protein